MMLCKKHQNIFHKILSGDFTQDTFDDISVDEWQQLFKFAKKQNLQIIVYNLLKKNKIKLPEDLARQMRNIYYAACAKDIDRRDQLKEIIQLFNDNGIAHILLKGSALSNGFYQNSSWRLMCDIDILVREEDGVEAYGLLMKNGYKGFIKSTEECEQFKGGFPAHYPQLKKEACLAVELHTCLSEIYSVNLKGVWERARPLSIDNIETKIMCPEDLIMHISLHKFLQDTAINGLLGLFDISQIINDGEINWGRLKGLTADNEYGNSRCLYLVLVLSGKLLNIKIADDFLDSIKPDAFHEDLEKTVTGLLFTDYSKLHRGSFFLGIRVNESIHSISTVWRRLFLSRYKMGLYGHSKYQKGDLTFRNLSVLYVKRTLTLVNRYGSAFAKTLFIKNKNKKSLKLGRDCARIKYWLSNQKMGQRDIR